MYSPKLFIICGFFDGLLTLMTQQECLENGNFSAVPGLVLVNNQDLYPVCFLSFVWPVGDIHSAIGVSVWSFTALHSQQG